MHVPDDKGDVALNESNILLPPSVSFPFLSALKVLLTLLRHCSQATAASLLCAIHQP